MMQAICTKIERNRKGQITGYHLIDNDGVHEFIQKEKLKTMIKDGKIQVINLILTSDNRLVLKNTYKLSSKLPSVHSLREL